MHREHFILRQPNTKCIDVSHLRLTKRYTHTLILAEATNTKTLDFWNPCLNCCLVQYLSALGEWAKSPSVIYKAFPANVIVDDWCIKISTFRDSRVFPKLYKVDNITNKDLQREEQQKFNKYILIITIMLYWLC